MLQSRASAHAEVNFITLELSLIARPSAAELALHLAELLFNGQGGVHVQQAQARSLAGALWARIQANLLSSEI